MDLARFPRIRPCHGPTPLESLENLTKEMGGPTLFTASACVDPETSKRKLSVTLPSRQPHALG